MRGVRGRELDLIAAAAAWAGVGVVKYMAGVLFTGGAQSRVLESPRNFAAINFEEMKRKNALHSQLVRREVVCL